MILIDAELLKKEISDLDKWLIKRDKEGHGTTLGELLGRVQYVISNQSTAYDVDKVVEELKDYADSIPFIELDKVIEIVKAGGKE